MKKNHLPARDDFSEALSELCSPYSGKSLTGEIRPGSFATQKKQIILARKMDEMSGILTDLAYTCMSYFDIDSGYKWL